MSKSTMTIANPTAEITSSGRIIVAINATEQNAVHEFAFKFSTDSDSTYVTTSTQISGASYTWNLSSYISTLANKIPSARIGVWTVRLTTKVNGTSIGTDTANVTLTIPDISSYRPQFSGTPTIAPYPNNPSISGNSAFAGMYVVGRSKVKASNYAATAKYGATIVSYQLLVPDEESVPTTTGSTITTPYKLAKAGSKAVQIRATDSRGIVSTSTAVTIMAYDYATPSFYPYNLDSEIRIGRCSSSSATKPNKTGTDFLMRIGRRIAPIGGINTCGIYLTIKNSSGTVEYEGDRTDGMATNLEFLDLNDFINSMFAQDDHYTVIVTSTDLFGGSASLTVEVYSITPLIHISPKSKAIGFKCTPTADRFENNMLSYFKQSVGIGKAPDTSANRVDIAWPTYIEAGIYPRLINSHDAGASSGYYTRMLVVPRYTADDILSGTPDTTPPYETYFRAWLTKICQDYGPLYGAANLLVTGVAQPSTRFLVQGNIYDVSDTVSGLPRYCSFAAYPEGTEMTILRFGTYEGTWYAEEYVPNSVKTGTLTYVTNSVITSSSNLGMTLRKSGNVVTLDCQPTFAAVDGGTAPVTVATLPSGYLPQSQVVQSVPGQGSSSSNYMCSFYALSGGDIRVYKHNTSTATYRANLTWIVA